MGVVPLLCRADPELGQRGVTTCDELGRGARPRTARARRPFPRKSTVAELTRIGESELDADVPNCRRRNSLRELSYRVALPGDTGTRNGNINSRRAKSWFEAEIGLLDALHLAPMTGFRRERFRQREIGHDGHSGKMNRA